MSYEEYDTIHVSYEEDGYMCVIGGGGYMHPYLRTCVKGGPHVHTCIHT